MLFGLALCGNPELVFVDEPTTGLDADLRRTLWATLRSLARAGRGVVLTTHYLEEADALADRIAVIDEGRIIAQGTPAELKELVPEARVTIIEADLPDAALEALRARFGSARRRQGGAEIDDLEVGLDAVVDVLRPMGVAVRSTYRRQITLDDVFVHLTGKELRQ